MGEADDQPTSGRFEGGEHRLPLRVYFEDTDAGGVVYHATYLGYMERARAEMLRLAGIRQRDAIEAGEGVYVIANINIGYRMPAKLDDMLVVASRIATVGGSSIGIHQRVMRGSDLVAEADVTAVFVTPGGRPRRPPADWTETFRRLQGEACLQ